MVWDISWQLMSTEFEPHPGLHPTILESLLLSSVMPREGGEQIMVLFLHCHNGNAVTVLCSVKNGAPSRRKLITQIEKEGLLPLESGP